MNPTPPRRRLSIRPPKANEPPPPPPRLIHHPIQPVTEPMQYRAIGVVAGRYLPSEEQFTRGILVTDDGVAIDAVLLGKVMNYVRKHTQSEQEYLWVVYPRTRDNPEGLHLQIVGVWGPFPDPNVPPDIFSIRGEITSHDPTLPPEQAHVLVRIRIQPPKPTSRPRYFRLRLLGSLPTSYRAVHDFWDLQVRRQGSRLVIQEGIRIGSVLRKPRPKSKKSPSRPRRDPGLSRPVPKRSLPPRS
ncbi:MAG: hypothetical protein Q6K99_01375 [Thermostichales cyanobacterium BF4_bins_65]